MKKTKIEIITPLVASSDRELDLVHLTEFLSKKFNLDTGYGLGGQFGYGVEYRNDVFEMFPYYWGDCTCDQNDESFEEPHDEGCYQLLVDAELKENGWEIDKEFGWLERPKKMKYEESEKIENKIRKKYCKQFGLTFPLGCAVHCTCTHNKRYDDWFNKNKKGKGWHADDCLLEKPNFKHFASGLEVRWYKWIGRNMEYTNEISDDEWQKIYNQCLQSIK